MGTLSHIMLMYLMWMITSLLVGYSHEQDILGAAYNSPQAAPLVGQRQSRIPSQQVIVPGGFQPHQLYPNQFSNFANSNGRLVQTPISIQNQQFAFVPRADPFARGLSVAGSARASPTSPSLGAVVKPTSSRSLSPNFVEIISPSPQRLVSSNRVIGGTNGQIPSASASSQQPNAGGDRNAADVQYEYYDETDGDVLYQYGNDFNEPAGPSSSAGGSKQTGQYFSEVSSSRPGKNGVLQRNPTPTTAASSKREPATRYSPSSSAKPAQVGSVLPSSKSVIPSGTANRLFRPNRPSPFAASTSSNSEQASRETSSSFIPLIDEHEEPEQGLALNGRSVQSSSHRGNSLSGVRPPLTLLRSSTTAAPSTSAPEASSSEKPSPSAPEKLTSRVRGVYSRVQSRQNSSSVAGSSRRPAVLRGNSSSGNSRLSATSSRPPIIIRPRNLTRSRTYNKTRKEDPIASSSTYRPDPNFDQTGSSSSENPSVPGNSLPSAEDYTVEYVEYPFNNDDNSSVVEYYEVSEETAQALLQRAKAKANQRKSLEHSPKSNKTSSSSSVSSRTSSSSNETATKVTVSVSSKSSSSTTTSTTSTTVAPTAVESTSSEENISADQVDPSSEVVISVATTKSVSGKKDVTQVPKHLTTATPRVSYSKATGSSFVVASVQTSRSVGKASGHDGRTGKTIHEKGETLKDNMPSGAETAPEYYEEEYTYPDNYPVLNNDAGSLLREHDDEEQDAHQDHYNPNEYSHEVSIPPSVVTPTKSVILQSTEYYGVSPSSASVAESSNQVKESSEASVTSAVAKTNADDETYDEESGSHAPQPRKLPSKKGDIPLNHFETLVDDVSELEVDHPLRTVNQGDLSPPPDDEASYHAAAIQPSIATLTTTAATTTTPAPTTSTEKVKAKDPVSILSSIRFAEVSPNFLPPGFKLPPASSSSSPENQASSSETTTPTTTTSSTTSTQATPTQGNKALGVQFDEINIASLLPKGYKPRPTPPRASFPPITVTTTEKPVEPSTTKTVDPLEAIKSIVQFKEIAIPGLVPKDYTPPPATKEDTKEPNVTSSFAGIRFETPANLLPPGYKPPSSPPSPVVPIKFETPSNLLPKGYKPLGGSESVDPIKFEFPANLLPPGYKPPGSASEAPAPSSTEATAPSSTESTTKKPGGLVFPTKAGGVRITRPTTTEPPKGDTPLPPAVRIATGWPTRKTTAFTGWPTTPTTPMPSTSSTTTTTTTEKPTTTTPTTTTTTPPPKLSATGTCPQGVCRMEASIRIVGGVKWVPEFQDINTDEYKHLETTVKRELDGAYRSSSLAPFYRKVEIEGFNRGSVIVDYFVLLDGIDREISTDSVRGQFHKALLDSADELPFYDEDSPDQLVSNGRLRFGRYTIDPRYTDFKVVNITKDSGPLAQDPLIPQWGIAVIVIGLASLLFVIIFGVTVLVNRHKNSKKKNAVSLTQEMLSEFNKSHMGSGAGGLDNYGADDLYNMDDVWNDKQMDKTFDRKPTKRSQGSGKGSANYNIYDSWKTEWNGYYYNGNYYGDSGYAPSRRRSDYDTNF